MKPRVLFNCKWKCHGRLTGVQRYASELVRSMDDACFESDKAQPRDGSAAWRTIFWEQCTLPKIAEDYDALMCPANMAPARLSREVGLVLVVHCLRFHSHPENYSRAFGAWYRYMIPRLIDRADRVVTVSHTSAAQIVDVYPNAQGKVEVVSPGVSCEFQPLIESVQSEQRVCEQPYWVYVGNASPAKNLCVVLDALRTLDASHKLVMLGVSHDQYERIGGDQPDPRVIPLGHINDTARVASILRNAQGLLAPSRYESFDLPIIEAMASGCPVIASDIPVHREIGGDAAMYVSHTDSRMWADAMDELTKNPEQLLRMRQLGLSNAQRFSWEQAANQMIQIINQVHTQRIERRQ